MFRCSESVDCLALSALRLGRVRSPVMVEERIEIVPSTRSQTTTVSTSTVHNCVVQVHRRLWNPTNCQLYSSVSSELVGRVLHPAPEGALRHVDERCVSRVVSDAVDGSEFHRNRLNGVVEHVKQLLDLLLGGI